MARRQSLRDEKTGSDTARAAGQLLSPNTATSVMRSKIQAAALLSQELTLSAAESALLQDDLDRAVRVAASALTQRG